MKTKPHKSQDGTRQGEGGAWLGEMQAMEILGRTKGFPERRQGDCAFNI